ncbi:MAG: outer membrane beta-barrel protein [Cellvibrionales bacterium]|nr:outer membrane beta-barrel protein [Cellvibrionales bacterium]
MSALKKAVVGVVLASCTVGVQAHKAGDIIVRVGATNVTLDDSISTPELNGNALYGANVSVDSDTRLGVTGTYMITDNFGVGLLAAAPFQHRLNGNSTVGAAFGTTDLGKTRLLPPTLTAQYYFNNSTAFTPYLGAGVNYSWFYGEDASRELNTTLGGDVDLDIDNSWGYALEAGLDVDIGNNWLVNAGVWYFPVDTEATYTVKNGPLASSKVKANVEADVWVYMASIGYRF